MASLKEDWVCKGHFTTYINVKHEGKHARPACPQGIIEGREPIWVESLARISVLKYEVKLAEYKNYIFVKVVAEEIADAPVGMASMNLEKDSDMLKLSNSEICSSCSLSSLLTLHSDSNVGLHYHWDIIGSISQCQRNPRPIFLRKCNNISLLLRACSATYYGICLASKADKQCCKYIICQYICQCCTINDQGHFPALSRLKNDKIAINITYSLKASLSLITNSVLDLAVRTIISMSSRLMRLQDFAISMAVSYLSPVRIQTLTLASIRCLIVSGTSSYNLSSTAVQPRYVSSCSISSQSSPSLASLSSQKDNRTSSYFATHLQQY